MERSRSWSGLLSVLLLSMAALGTDLGQAWAQKRQIQGGSDMATLAGAGISGNDLPAPSVGKVCSYGTGALADRPGVDRRGQVSGVEVLLADTGSRRRARGNRERDGHPADRLQRPERGGVLRPAERQQDHRHLVQRLQQEPVVLGQPAEQGRLRVRTHPRVQQRQRGRAVDGRDSLAEVLRAAVLRLQRLRLRPADAAAAQQRSLRGCRSCSTSPATTRPPR